MAGRGKSSTGWFYGFKLHLLVDDRGQILSFRITRGNVDDRIPLPGMLKKFIGKVFGDRGYISKKLTNYLHPMMGVDYNHKKNYETKSFGCF